MCKHQQGKLIQMITKFSLKQCVKNAVLMIAGVIKNNVTTFLYFFMNHTPMSFVTKTIKGQVQQLSQENS